MKTLIELKDISYSRQNREILKKINLTVEENDRIIILGENGCGKTTLLNVLIGDILPNTGKINRNLNSTKIGVVYDRFSILPMLKVKEVLRLFCTAYSIDYKKMNNKYFDLFRLSNIIDNYILNLSMGERRRVSILLSLLHNPLLLVMDEPFSSVDPTIIEDLLSIIHENKGAVIYTTHDWSAENLKDNIIFMMYNGNLKKSQYSLSELISSAKSPTKLICNRVEWNGDDEKIMYYTKDGNTYILGDPQMIIQKFGITSYEVEKINMQDLYYITNKY